MILKKCFQESERKMWRESNKNGNRKNQEAHKAKYIPYWHRELKSVAVACIFREGKRKNLHFNDLRLGRGGKCNEYKVLPVSCFFPSCELFA